LIGAASKNWGEDRDLGATDAPLSPRAGESGPCAISAGDGGRRGVNLPGVKPGDIVIDGPTLAQIYLGKITNWNDPAPKAINPKLDLPTRPIVPIHRADGSGTTFNSPTISAKSRRINRSQAATTVDRAGGIGAKGTTAPPTMSPPPSAIG
jgi:phosphate transport system substrate-binding protein